jgi:putative PIG3 family NAD(P)H quinone oxidoreductase
MSIPKDMIAIEIAAPGGPDALRPRAMPVPEPGPGEALIRVAAAGVNAPDLAQRRGLYPPPPGASPLPGLEVSGEIVALGPGAERHALGDIVVALCNGGGYAEYVAAPEGQVLPLPRGWSPVAGAALPETYFTIQQTLMMKAGLEPGMTVLVHGAAGGLGGAAIAIATACGAHTIGVVSSPEKATYARSLGAMETIDRRHEDIVKRVKAITGGRGVDRVVDIVGGPTLAASLAAAAVEAHILVLATLAGAHAEINAGLIVSRRLTLHGSTLRPQPKEVKAAIAGSLRAEIWPRLESGEILEPKIETFPLPDAAAAHVSMERPSHFGKTVLVTDFGRQAI